MKRRNIITILLATLPTGLLVAAPASAEVEHDGDTPVVVVDNDGKRYTRVRTAELEYVVAVRVDLPKGATPAGGSVFVGKRAALPRVDGSRGIDIEAGDGWNLTKLRFPYSPPRGFDGKQVFDPVAVCNQNLDAKTGTAAAQMKSNGLRVMLPAAYPVKVVVGYWEKKRLGIRNDGSKTLQGTFPVWLECAPLTGPKVRTKTTTTGSGSGGPRVKRLRDINPMGDIAFTATPTERQLVGGRYCPLSLRLSGTVESVKAFTGHATFFGSDYVSPPQPVELGNSHIQTVAASIPLDWSSAASKSFSRRGPRGRNSRDYLLQMQVADSTGRVLGTTEKTTFTVSCEPMRVSPGGSAGTTPGDPPSDADIPAAPVPAGAPDPLVRGISPRDTYALEVFVHSRNAVASGCQLDATITIDRTAVEQSINVSTIAAGATIPVLVNATAPLSEVEAAVFTLRCPHDRDPSNNVGLWPTPEDN